MATKTYKKFLTGAAAAAMVASAVAPVAAQGQDVAQTSAFTDVGLDDYFMEITEANELGFVSGYDAGEHAGKFLPYQKISRGHVVKILAKYVLQSKGMTLSEYNAKYDLKSVEKFDDLSDDHPDQELVNYSKIVKNEGIFEGSNNNLMHEDNIQRQQIASVLVRAFKLQDKEGTPELTDLDEAFDAHAKAVEIFAEHGVTDQETFRPKEHANRGQFTAFLMRAYKVSQGVSPEKPLSPIESVETLGDITINVGETPDLPETVTVTHENGLKSQANVEWDTTSLDNEAVGTYPLTGDVEGTDLTAKVNVIVKEAPSADATVTSAKALNAKQIQLTFNREVGTGASDVGNYAVRVVPNGDVNPVKHAAVQSDGKSVILTLTNGYRVSTDVSVSADGIFVEDSIKETFPKFSTVVTVNDTVEPAVTGIVATTNTNAAQVATVTFSEPIDKKPIFKVDGKVVSPTWNTETTETVATLSNLNLAADSAHTLEVIGYADYAENEVAISTHSFNISKDTTSATGKVRAIQDNKLAIDFDKAVNVNSLSNVQILRYDGSEYVTVTDLKPHSTTNGGKTAILTINDGEAAKFFGLNDNTEELLIKVNSNVVDINGNPVKAFEEKVTVTQDVTGPALADVTYAKNSKGEVEKLYFHFNEALVSAPSKVEMFNAVSVVDRETNQPIKKEDVIGTSGNETFNVELASDKKTLVLTVGKNADNKLKAGLYEFTVAKDLVNDSSFAKNANVRGSKVVNFGARENEVLVNNIVRTYESPKDGNGYVAQNKFTVTFSSPVTADSAKNPANYSINGTALPEGTVIQVTDTTAAFTLPAGTIADGDTEAVINVKNVKPQNSSATFNDYVGTEKVTDNTRPVASGEVLENGVIQLTFSEAISALDETDFVNVVLNGKTLDQKSTEATTLTRNADKLPNGRDIVTIEVEAKVSEDHGKVEEAGNVVVEGTGFTYQYIDVDGDDKLDLEGDDIVIKQVKSKEKPSEWTDVADLNLLQSVVVLTGTSTNTADMVGNRLATNKQIKVK